MAQSNIKNVIIVGGGTSGWMTAAALSHFFDKDQVSISLIESETIGTVGVGEATIPHLRFFNEKLGIDEHEFMRTTNATYKLGIDFIDWGRIGESYIHPFGDFGRKINDLDFYHYWIKAQKEGLSKPIFDFSIPVLACKSAKFEYPSSDQKSLLSDYSYAFQIDASAYAQYLRRYSENKGVKRIEGKIVNVNLNNDTGNIESVKLENDSTQHADFFIDCSGFRSLLLGEALEEPFEDWSKWLPCDRAIAVPTESNGELLPYTKATALSAGWQWKIPLQHRTGNGHVYCSSYMEDDEAADILTRQLDGKMLANLNQLKFKAGRRRNTWSKNCVSIGLSSGFLEPLESTSIYLIQAAITKFIELFPQDKCDHIPRKEFNRQIVLEYDRIKDFLILHYHATHRDDSDFWNYCRTMTVPDTLTERMEAFNEVAHVKHYEQGLFLKPSWIAVLIGQGFTPKSYHPFADAVASTDLHPYLNQLHKEMSDQIQSLGQHSSILQRHCSANPGEYQWPKSAMSLYGVFS